MAEFSDNRHISNLINMSCKVVFVLVRRPRRVVEEECVTLMSCCPRIFFKVLEREEW